MLSWCRSWYCHSVRSCLQCHGMGWGECLSQQHVAWRWHSCRWELLKLCCIFAMNSSVPRSFCIFSLCLKWKLFFGENYQQKNCFLGTDLDHSYCCLPLSGPGWCWSTAERGCCVHVISCSLVGQREGFLQHRGLPCCCRLLGRVFSGYVSLSTSKPSCFFGGQEFS